MIFSAASVARRATIVRRILTGAALLVAVVGVGVRLCLDVVFRLRLVAAGLVIAGAAGQDQAGRGEGEDTSTHGVPP
jgi:hypothetical protein